LFPDDDRAMQVRYRGDATQAMMDYGLRGDGMRDEIEKAKRSAILKVSGGESGHLLRTNRAD